MRTSALFGAKNSNFFKLSVRLVDGRLGLETLAESDQKTLKVGINSFPA